MDSAYLVITSIAGPENSVLNQYSKECESRGIPFILIGDIASPSDFSLSGCQFYDIEAQKKLDLRCADNLPFHHYSRKNIGYLLAIKEGAKIIIETDDDNIPLDRFWDTRIKTQKGRLIEEEGWINLYSYYTDGNIWPRGFPLDRIKDTPPIPENFPLIDVKCPIQQGLANDNPDVDAVYRLVAELPVRFKNARNFILGDGSWCPFNSQNTTWFPGAFPLLYLPSFCSFRMTDIWRSFVAQRICWTNGWGILFHSPTVYQERNEHDLMKDFHDEIDGYLHNSTICEALALLDLKNGTQHIPGNMIKCYERLVELGHIDRKELPILEAWLLDIENIT